MPPKSPVGVLSKLAAPTEGVFRGAAAVAAGVSRDQLALLRSQAVIARLLPDTYALTAVANSDAQRLRAALLWAGEGAAAAGRSAATVYGLEGVRSPRKLLRELDPEQPSRSTLEVKTRRLLVANGYRDFVREFPLAWNGRTYRFDFAFERRRTILETNGRRWHDDATDYEHDNDKWSVPGRHDYKLVFATWDKVTRRPDALLEELAATLAGRPVTR
jgi:very-short-patch-repair endonuclease